VGFPGKTPVYPFTVSYVNGQSVIGIRGTTIIDGTLDASRVIVRGSITADSGIIGNAAVGTLQIAGSSVMVGLYDQGFSSFVPGLGSSTLISRWVSLGDRYNSGLIVAATVSCNCDSNATVGFQIRINGVVCGDQRASIQSGYGYLFPVSGFGYADSNGNALVELVAYNPSGSDPGANKSFNVTGSTMSVMGGKR
jgi:hypothetical protein